MKVQSARLGTHQPAVYAARKGHLTLSAYCSHERRSGAEDAARKVGHCSGLLRESFANRRVVAEARRESMRAPIERVLSTVVEVTTAYKSKPCKPLRQ